MKMVKTLVKATLVLGAVVASTGLAFAEGSESAGFDLAPIGAGLAIGIAAIGGTMAQGRVVSSMLESSARNPSAAGKLTVPFFVGIALIESLVILAFVIAIQQ